MVTPERPSEDSVLIGSPEDLVWRGDAEELAGNQKKLRDLPEFCHVKGILFPDDDFVRYWQLLIAALLIYTATVTVYRIAFVDSEPLGWLIADTIIDSLFFTDIVVNCFLSYYNLEMNLITSRPAIFKNYLRTWMIIDLISCLPFQYIIGSDKNYSNVVRVARLPRLYKLIKVTKMMRMLKVFKDRSQLYSYTRSVVQLSIGLERLIWMLVTFLLLIHLIACFWALIGKLDETDENWIFYYEYLDKDSFDLYIISFYWSITTLATVGYGDIVAKNNIERTMCSFVMLIGIFLYSYVISSITSLIGNLDTRKSKLSKKMGLLNELARQFNISKLFYKKLSKAIEYENSRSLSIELTELIDGLPSKIRSELLFVIHKKMIESNTFFEGKSLFFVADVSELLRPQKAEMREVIYKEDEFAFEMYLIYKGEVSFVLMPEMLPYSVVNERYYFGETDILVSEKGRHLTTAMANTSCELFTIDKDRLLKLLEKYPEIQIEMHTLAKERYQRIEELKISARNDFVRSFSVKRRVSNPQSFISKNRFVNMIVKKQLKMTKEVQEQDEDDMDEDSDLKPSSSTLMQTTSRIMESDKSSPSEEVESPFKLASHFTRGQSINLHDILQKVTTHDKVSTRSSTYVKLKKKVSRLEESIEEIKRSQSLILSRIDSVLLLKQPST